MYRVRVQFTGPAGAPWLATHFFGQLGGTTQQAATAAGNFWGAVDAQMDSAVSWSTLPEVMIVNETSGEIESVTATTPVTGTGAVSAVMLPRASQGLVRWSTGIFIGGRQIRGRTFIPGLTVNTTVTDGVLNFTTVSVIDAAAAALIADANSDLRIYSPANGTSASVIAGSTWAEYAQLRSRRD